MKWFDREFQTDLPDWMADHVLERLRGTPARLEDRAATLGSESLTRHNGGAWSVQENVGHLLDLEPLWLGRVNDILERKEILREADLANRKTHEANHNGRRIAELLNEFRQARSRFVQAVEGQTSEHLSLSSLHPRLKQPMRILDLMYFVAEHDDHHLVLITQQL